MFHFHAVFYFTVIQMNKIIHVIKITYHVLSFINLFLKRIFIEAIPTLKVLFDLQVNYQIVFVVRCNEFVLQKIIVILL